MAEFKIGCLVMTKGLSGQTNNDGFILENGITGQLLKFAKNPYTGEPAAEVDFPCFKHHIGINLMYLVPLNDPDTDTSDVETKELENA
jgi:hypothetical protein